MRNVRACKIQLKKPNTKIRLLAGLLSMCLILGTFFALFTVTETAYAANRTIRIGFYELSKIMEIEEDGSCAGMIPELLARTSSYTNWNIEYVICDSRQDALSQLQNGEVDFVPAIQKSSSLPEGMIYADIACGYTYNAIMCLKGDNYAFEDYGAIYGARIGIVENYLAKDALEDFLKLNGVTAYSLVEYPSVEQLKNACASREVDLIAADFIDITYDYRAIDYFEPRPFFYVTTEDKQDLADELIMALTELNIDYPGYSNGLFAEFYDEMTYDPDTLTLSELAYLHEIDCLRVGYVDNEFPFSYEENGQFCGVARESLEGEDGFLSYDISFEYINVHTAAQGVEALKNGDIDILCYYSDLDRNPNELGVRLAKCYSNNYYSIAMLESGRTTDIQTIATTEEYLDMANFERESSFSFVYYDTLEDCMNAVRRGEVDACAGSYYQIQKIRYQYYRFSDISLCGNIGSDDNIYFVVDSNADDRLSSVIRKLTDRVDSSTANQYVVSHVARGNYVFARMLIVSGLALLVAILVGLYFIRQYINSRKVRKLTSLDSELGIWNSSFFHYHVSEHVKKNSRTHYAIVFLYLSQYRTYSTINGYDESKKILLAVLECLKTKCLNLDDEHYARGYGGRFLLLLEANDREKLQRRLEGMRRMIMDSIYEIDQSPMPVCFGVAYIDPWTHDIDTAMASANLALDSLKNSEVAQTVVYDEAFDNRMKEQYARDKELESASLKTDFTVYYQSKVDIRTGRIVGAEALVRFLDPNDGGKVKTPYFFIDYFEHTGKIKKLDFFVLNEVCRMLRGRLNRGLPVVPISCNFSRIHFSDARFAEQLKLVVDSYEIPHELIEIEVTETALVEEFSDGSAMNCMDHLVEEGFHLSVDDFGTGYSSLGVLEQIPASVIKLDRSFFRNEKDHDRKVAILKSFVVMAHELDVSVVCEGVEFDEDVELMEQIKAYIAQGYRYSKPEPLEQFTERIDN